MITEQYRKALERIATLDGIKGFDGEITEAAHQLFALVCKMKNIAKDALNVDHMLIDPELVEIVREANTNVDMVPSEKKDNPYTMK